MATIKQTVRRATATIRHAVVTTTVPDPGMTITTTLSAGDPDVVPPLTKEQAMADTMRALQACYPDRWERVWDALGKESANDVLAAELAKAGADSPTMALGALLGGIVGAALGSRTRRG